MRNARKYEPLVPISDLWQAGHGPGAGVSLMPGRTDEQASYLAEAYGVVVLRDHADRHAVSLADAYKIRDARKRAQQELLDAHTAEVLEAGRVAEWQIARDRYWAANLPETGRRHPYGREGWGAINSARQATADACMAAERAAGIDEDLQRGLTWPNHRAILGYTDSGAPYQPPTF